MTVDPGRLATGLIATLGLRFAALTADEVTISWTIDDRHLQPDGIVHGGVYCAVVEAAASVGASAAVAAEGRFAVGVNNNTDFLRATTGAGARWTTTLTPSDRTRGSAAETPASVATARAAATAAAAVTTTAGARSAAAPDLGRRACRPRRG